MYIKIFFATLLNLGILAVQSTTMAEEFYTYLVIEKSGHYEPGKNYTNIKNPRIFFFQGP